MLQVAANRNERFCLGLMWFVKELIGKAEQHFSELVAQQPR